MKKSFLLLITPIIITMPVFASDVPTGTLIVVQPQKTIDADDVKLYDKVDFSTLKAVKVDGKTVFEANTNVQGKITKRKNNGILGIPGEIEVGEFVIITDNDEIRLKGDIANKGENRYWANVGWIILWPLLFIKGDDGKIMKNTTHMLYTAEDYNF